MFTHLPAERRTIRLTGGRLNGAIKIKPMSIRRLTPDAAEKLLAEGLAVDLRPIAQYLEKHLHGSISILWEQGPGFATRARDLLPLNARLVLLEDGVSPLDQAAAQLRGKGFDVEGCVGADEVPALGRMISTRPSPLQEAGSLILLDVGDPGTRYEERVLKIPAELLWEQHGDIDLSRRLGVLAGYGVRAATAVGILERLGSREITFIQTLPEGAEPRVAGREVFRAGGPG